MRRLDPRICPGCGTTFQPRRGGSAYCNHECYAQHRKGRRGPGNFAPGTVPSNKAPVGTVRIRTRHKRGGERRAYVKVAEPNVWQLRARVVWEAERGAIPAGMDVHHINRDKLDDRIENLELLTSADHAAEHVEDRNTEGKRASLRATFARARVDAVCECGAGFTYLSSRGVVERCRRCRHRDASARFKAKMRGHTTALPNMGN